MLDCCHYQNSSKYSSFYRISWLTVLLGVMLPLKDKHKFKKVVLEQSQKVHKLKFGQAHSNDEEKIPLLLILHFTWDFRI